MEYSQLKSFSASTLQGNWYEERLLTHERTVDNQPTQSRPFEPELPVERMKRIPHVPTSPLPNDGIVSYSTTSTDYRGEPKHQEKPVKTPILSEQNIAEIYNERSTQGNQAPFNETLPTHPPTHDARYFETSTHATYQKPAVPAHPRSTSKGSITAQVGYASCITKGIILLPFGFFLL
eukprot:TRINITY_DN3482_c0_g1_i4.p1 TRINITY_DN3482_c0_g1~~TRINITY_DN3482_c0_g1_i4.p1  ORF type:complete len:178 (-),score=28.96 TRINITY_DN3482_c0_g1_i4:664-1197(-)